MSFHVWQKILLFKLRSPKIPNWAPQRRTTLLQIFSVGWVWFVVACLFSFRRARASSRSFQICICVVVLFFLLFFLFGHFINQRFSSLGNLVFCLLPRYRVWVCVCVVEFLWLFVFSWATLKNSGKYLSRTDPEPVPDKYFPEFLRVAQEKRRATKTQQRTHKLKLGNKATNGKLGFPGS